MPKIHPTAIIEDDVKIGRLNFPTIAVAMLVLSVLSLFAIKFNRQQNDFLFGLFLVSGLIASVFGVVILIWCFLRRKQFYDENVKNYLWQTVLLGFIALTSPIWLIVASLFIIGFNR